MRTAFIEALRAVAATDDRVWLVTADLGYSVVESFAAAFPGRYLNVGVAEQNMVGVAAGLALCGKVVFCYSIANFPTIRSLEQIRNDVCLHKLDVKIVAVGCGLTYGSAGYSHHAVEDLAIVAALPNIAVVAPGDPVEARLATRALAIRPGPAYLRLGKAGEPIVHATDPEFEIGRAIRVRAGRDATIVSTGGMLQAAVEAARRLESRGLSADVLSCHTLQPLDEDAILASARTTRRVLTVEEHGPGGLGTYVGEALARSGLGAAFRPLRMGGSPVVHAGDRETLLRAAGLSADGIVAAVESSR